MSELIIYDKKNLPAEISEVLSALSSQFVKDMTDAELFDYLLLVITKCFTDSGYNKPENISYFITEVLNDVRQACKWQALRKDELSIAFYKGIRKEYGDYVGLPVVRFAEFIKGYMTSGDRSQALAEKNKPMDIISEPTEQEKFNLAKDNALRAYQDLKEGRDINLYGSIVYDFLNGLKLIEMSGKDKWQLIDEAMNQILREKEVRCALVMDKIKVADLNKEIADIRKGIVTPLVVKRAKCLTLTSWMQGLIIDEVDLNGLINNENLLS
jgi:hypothetical protein